MKSILYIFEEVTFSKGLVNIYRFGSQFDLMKILLMDDYGKSSSRLR